MIAIIIAPIVLRPGPVFDHFKSGMRALTLHALGGFLHGRLAAGEVIERGCRFGFDLEGAEAWLERRAALQP